jgi:hypothetical protein
MATVDLPEGVAAHLLKSGSESYQRQMSQGGDVSQLANGVLQAAMARNFDELGIKESRAVSGVVATPVASPTTQQG